MPLTTYYIWATIGNLLGYIIVAVVWWLRIGRWSVGVHASALLFIVQAIAILTSIQIIPTAFPLNEVRILWQAAVLLLNWCLIWLISGRRFWIPLQYTLWLLLPIVCFGLSIAIQYFS